MRLGYRRKGMGVPELTTALLVVEQIFGDSSLAKGLSVLVVCILAFGYLSTKKQDATRINEEKAKEKADEAVKATTAEANQNKAENKVQAYLKKMGIKK